MRNYDLDFLKRFSLVIAFLMAVTLGLILFAMYLHQRLPGEPNPIETRRTESRIAPIGAVYAGATGEAAQIAADQKRLVDLTKDVPFGGRTDGGEIFSAGPCAGCHKNGTGGAPMLTAAGMGARLAKGKDMLYTNAIKGYTGSAGVMPAKGGNPALTDDQVKATVDWMLENLQ